MKVQFHYSFIFWTKRKNNHHQLKCSNTIKEDGASTSKLKYNKKMKFMVCIAEISMNLCEGEYHDPICLACVVFS